MARAGDEARVRKLQADGLSQREIARQTGIPRTTVQDILKRAAKLPASALSESTPDVHVDVPAVRAKGTPKIHRNTRPVSSADVPAVHSGVSPVLVKGVPEVHIDIQLLQELGALWPDLQDLVAEWRVRKAMRRGPYDASRETQLKTYHVEKRHIDRIATYTKEVGLKQSEVVNEAFRQFFEGK
jgi:transcriptional regulator with XRE-family HTH domain